jgi:DNA polymerase-4
MLTTLQEMAGQVSRRLHELGLAGRTVSVKARFGDFQTVTRAHTVAQPIWRREDISACLPELFAKAVPTGLPVPTSVRLLGVTVSSFADEKVNSPDSGQLSLLDEILHYQPAQLS